MSDTTFEDQSDALLKQLASGANAAASPITDVLGRSARTAAAQGADPSLSFGSMPFDDPRSDKNSGRDVVMDIPVTMKVVLGSATMPVAALQKLARGSIVKLDKKVGDAVDIFVNGRLIARGEVVVLDEAASRFGVTLTQVGSGLTTSK